MPEKDNTKLSKEKKANKNNKNNKGKDLSEENVKDTINRGRNKKEKTGESYQKPGRKMKNKDYNKEIKDKDYKVDNKDINNTDKTKSKEEDTQKIFPEDKIKQALKEKYGSIAEGGRKSCCGDGSESRQQEQSTSNSCCGADPADSEADSSSAAVEEISNAEQDSTEKEQISYEEKLGYDSEKLDEILAEASYGLGCGNPGAIASLKPGETVLDLGCGAGFDLLLAAREVGPEGRLIGVDMTPEMIEKARKNAEKNGLENAEFHLAEIENLPLEDSSVDVIMSNCVINLVPDKKSVYREAYRVLKPGGRLAISDVVKKREFPREIREDLESYLGCVAGAIIRQELENILQELNYQEIEIKPKNNSAEIVDSWSPDSEESGVTEGLEKSEETKFSDYIYSAYISAVKPEDRFSSADFAWLSRALGNQHRIEILQLLADQPAGNRCMVGNIVDELPISQSTVSQHLKVLKQAGWITGQVEGPSTCYCIDRQTIKKYRKMFEAFLKA